MFPAEIERFKRTAMFGGILEIDAKAPEFVKFTTKNGEIYTGRCKQNDYLANITDLPYPIIIKKAAFPVTFYQVNPTSIRLEFYVYGKKKQMRQIYVCLTLEDPDAWIKPPPFVELRGIKIPAGPAPVYNSEALKIENMLAILQKENEAIKNALRFEVEKVARTNADLMRQLDNLNSAHSALTKDYRIIRSQYDAMSHQLDTTNCQLYAMKKSQCAACKQIEIRRAIIEHNAAKSAALKISPANSSSFQPVNTSDQHDLNQIVQLLHLE